MSWTIERRGRVAVVTMTTNPVNAQNQAFFADLHDAFDRLERDHPDSPVVLAGTGRRFSAGLDLDEHFRPFAGDPAAVGSWFAGYRATNMRVFTYPRPTIAAINGHAFVGGLITAAVCDQRIAVTGEATFGLNEVPIAILMPAVYVRMLAYARLPGGGTTRHRRPGRPARHRTSQVNDQRARPARTPPLLAAAQGPPGAVVSLALDGPDAAATALASLQHLIDLAPAC